MKIELLYFAQLKEVLGTTRELIEVANGQTAAELAALLRNQPRWEAISHLPLSFAVNEELVDGGHVLRDGDRLAFLTPISGG